MNKYSVKAPQSYKNSYKFAYEVLWIPNLISFKNKGVFTYSVHDQPFGIPKYDFFKLYRAFSCFIAKTFQSLQ